MIHAGWMRMVGLGLIANRIMMIFLAVISGIVVASSLQRPLSRTGAALCGLAVVVATYPYHCYVSYNNYSMFFGILSACAIFSMRDARDGRRAFMAGLWASASFLSKQNLGGLALIAGGMAVFAMPVLSMNRFRLTIRYIAGALTPMAVLTAHAAGVGYTRAMIEQALLGGVGQAGHFADSYPVNQLALMKALLVNPSFGAIEAFTQSASYVLPFLVAVALLPFLIAALRAGETDRARLIAAAAIMTPLVALGAIHAPTTWHIIFVKPVPIIAIAFLLREISRHRVGRAIALGAFLLFFTLHLGRQIMIFDDYDSTVDAPHAAGIRIRPWESEVINRALAAIRTVPTNEPLFVAAPDPLYYHLSDRTPPLPWIYLDPPLVTDEFGEMLAERIEKSGAWTLVLSGRSPFFDYRRIAAFGRQLDNSRPVIDETVNGIRIALHPPFSREPS
jgi:hypothetical protein